MTEHDTCRLLEMITQAYKAILGEKLVGIYLHGSLAFGCFTWQNSDIDYIAAVKAPLTFGEKCAIIDAVLKLNESAPPKGIEMSVVTADVCRPFVYPTPYELHYSNSHREAYLTDRDRYIRKLCGTDCDLAAHFTVIRSVGKVLYGRPIDEVFAEVPGEYYLDSIKKDIETAADDIVDSPVYFTLNLCRVLAYLRDGLVVSKKQGGEWALGVLPAEYRAAVRSALAVYCGGDGICSDVDFCGFARYMLGQIL